MKTITCKQFGGPCNFEFHTNTADEAIKAQDALKRYGRQG